MKVSIVIVGFGNVAQSFVALLLRKKAYLHERFGLEFSIIGAADRGTEKDYRSAYLAKGLDPQILLESKLKSGTISAYPGGGCRDSPDDLIKTANADLLLETTSTNVVDGEPGLSHIRTALSIGTHVVTSNKGPLVFGWNELRRLASSKGINFRFGASVGGALPIIPTGRYSLLGSEVKSIHGILNGTTNYILTQMEEKQITMKEALADAQQMGIAEANPKLDLEGFDTAFKLLIAANAIMDANATLKEIDIEGIQDVTLERVRSARERGCALKLIGRADRANSTVKMRVGLEEIHPNHPFHWISGTWKSVLFDTDLLGEVLVSGGASNPRLTSGAVLRDMLDIAYDAGYLTHSRA